MMLRLETTSQFRKGYKRARKRGYDMNLLEAGLEKLQKQETLDKKYYDHALSGDHKGFRECHIQPDWLLIYAIHQEELVLIASETGTHADLFGK